MASSPRSFADGDALTARQWLASAFGPWADSLARPQRDAVRAYKGPAYRRLNAGLREGDAAVVSGELVRRLDEALALCIVPEPVVVWRGFADPAIRDALDAGADLIGDVDVDDAYLSTSLLPAVMERYLSRSDPDDQVRGRIVVPAGAHAVVYAGAPDLLDERDEFELLLPRATRLQICAVDTPAGSGDDVPTIHYEVIA